jgi:hypothetical protein
MWAMDNGLQGAEPFQTMHFDTVYSETIPVKLPLDVPLRSTSAVKGRMVLGRNSML